MSNKVTYAIRLPPELRDSFAELRDVVAWETKSWKRPPENVTVSEVVRIALAEGVNTLRTRRRLYIEQHFGGIDPATKERVKW